MQQNLAVASGIFLLLPLRVFRNMTIFAVGNLNYTMYKIIQAEYAGDYKILITFDDGQKRLADFYGFISKSLHPSIHKYIDKTLFQQFEFDNYGIHWGTQFDIDPYDIYWRIGQIAG